MKQANKKLEQFEVLWKSITSDLIPNLDKSFEEYATNLTEFLILSVLESDYFEIGILNENEASMVSYDIYNMEKHLTLYYKPNETWEIELHLEDDEGEDRDYHSILEPNKDQLIPVGLRHLMKETLEQETPRTVQANSLK